MNELNTSGKFTLVRGATAPPLHCIRYVLFFCLVLLLGAVPLGAQGPAAERKTITLEELQQMALQNNPTFAQAAANIQAAEGRKKQSGLYPNPTVGYQGEQIRGGSFHGGEQGFFVQQDISRHTAMGCTLALYACSNLDFALKSGIDSDEGTV